MWEVRSQGIGLRCEVLPPVESEVNHSFLLLGCTLSKGAGDVLQGSFLVIVISVRFHFPLPPGLTVCLGASAMKVLMRLQPPLSVCFLFSL